jgi:hypothetical protein
MMLLKGTIEHLQIGLARANLLLELSGSRTEKTRAFAEAIGTTIGSNGNAALSSEHDIGELEYFACFIGEELVHGVFPNVTFQEGDEVLVVVQPSGNNNYVRGIRKKTDGLMWIPLMMEKSIGATMFRSIKQVLWIMLLGYAGWGLFFLFGVLDPGQDLTGAIVLWSIPGGCGLFMGMWDFAASFSTGMQSTKVFRMLGIPDAYWINLSPYSLLNLDNDPCGECVYRIHSHPQD